MTSARDAILSAIGKASPPVGDRDVIRLEADELIAAPKAYQPSFEPQGVRARFIEKATSERVTATVGEIATLDDLPREVAAYLAQNDLVARVALQSDAALSALDWDVVETRTGISPDEPVAVAVADLAIAETGSVVLRSGPEASVLMNFLPLYHIVVVRAETIHHHLEDVFSVLGASSEEQPRNLCIVTGTSGTADIEAINIRGAHGPRFMHIVIVDRS